VGGSKFIGLLLVAEFEVLLTPVDTDEIMAFLDISRGSANMNLRNLVTWGLVKKTEKNGGWNRVFEQWKKRVNNAFFSLNSH
jgi:predicted transcriptional regulator